MAYGTFSDNEKQGAVLLGVYRNMKIKEIAKLAELSIGGVHGYMVRLRDEGYIKPWPPRKMQGKELTEAGLRRVEAMYGIN